MKCVAVVPDAANVQGPNQAQRSGYANGIVAGMWRGGLMAALATRLIQVIRNGRRWL
jgi:hypothetical protein